MAGQKTEVEGPKRRVRRIENVTVQSVMQNVADKKKCRERERRNHRGAMSRDPVRANKSEADEQRRCREAVKYGIHRRQECILRARCRRRMNVDQPKKKCCGRSANGQNGSDRASCSAL